MTLIALLLVASLDSFASMANESFLRPKNGVSLRVGIYQSEGEPKIDVLYLPGYGDIFTNHERLFKQLNQAGARVISFDYPNHGQTDVDFFNDLNFTTFRRLSQYVEHVEAETREDKSRPLAIIGWSTGGLLGTRILQGLGDLGKTRNITHAALIAPGVSVYTCVGEKFCSISNRTLTHDTNLHERPIHPQYPLSRPKFGSFLILNSLKAQAKALPKATKTLVMVGGEKADRYVKTGNVKSWVDKQRRQFKNSIKGIQCFGARHELHNESPVFGGPLIRQNIVAFINDLGLRSSSRCRRF